MDELDFIKACETMEDEQIKAYLKHCDPKTSPPTDGICLTPETLTASLIITAAREQKKRSDIWNGSNTVLEYLKERVKYTEKRARKELGEHYDAWNNWYQANEDAHKTEGDA